MIRLVVFLLLFAAVIYAFFWLVDRRNDPASGHRPRRQGGDPGGRTTQPGPRGPDDDEDFLRELDRERWNRERHGERGDTGDEA